MDSAQAQAPVDIAKMIDVSAVRADSDDRAVADAVACARQYGCFLVTTLPAQAGRTRQLLIDAPHIKLGGNVGFPSGGQTTHTKVIETSELVQLGVDEVDMVIDIGAHLSGRYDHVRSDIEAVVEAASGLPVKVILECHHLSDDQIRRGCDLAVEAGAHYVKTGTGWAPTGATLHNISVIQQQVKGTIGIKASGGIRDPETLTAMYELGVRRFGIAARHVPSVLSAPSRLSDQGA